MLLAISNEDKQKYFCKKERGGVVYKITNTINNDFYIGSSVNLNKRYYTHLNHMRNEKKTCIKLNRAVKKYNEDNFKFEIIAKCPEEYVLKLEQWFISNLNPNYNIAKIAGSNLGIKRTKKVKIERAKIQKLNWSNKEYREHHIQKLALNWKKGSLHKFAKVNEEIVKEIKLLLLESKTCLEISTQLNVSIHIVKDIKINKTWKHVVL
jgi:group I intron endonuclease